MKTKPSLFIIIIIGIGIFSPGLLLAEQGVTVRVAVLPFEVFSIEESQDLGRDLAIQLSRQLSLHPNIVIGNDRLLQSLLREYEELVLNEERLKEIASALDANFILFGSLTKIQEDMSLDLQLFNNFDQEPYFKTFAEGTTQKDLLLDIATKVEQEIMNKAALIPTSQLPKVEKPADVKKESVEVEITPNIAEAETKTLPEEEAAAPLEAAGVAEVKTHVPEKPVEETSIFSGETEHKEITPPPAVEQEIKSTKEIERAGKEKKEEVPFAFDRPVNIHADSLEYDNKRNRIIFKGNVVARQADVVIFADSMKALYDSNGEMEQIAAEGGVRIIQGEKIAIGEKVTFFNAQQKIVLTGNPRVWQGDNVIHGQKITVFLKEDRSVVEGSPENRVNATIYPQEQSEEKSKEDQGAILPLQHEEPEKIRSNGQKPGNKSKDEQKKVRKEHPELKKKIVLKKTSMKTCMILQMKT